MTYNINGTFEPTNEIENFLTEEEKQIDNFNLRFVARITKEDFLRKVKGKDRDRRIWEKVKRDYEKKAEQENRELSDEEISLITSSAKSQVNWKTICEARRYYNALKKFEVITEFKFGEILDELFK